MQIEKYTLTQENIRHELQNFADMGGCSTTVQAACAAQLIIMGALGDHFWRREYRYPKNTKSFLQHHWVVRSIDFARTIWRAKELPGFWEWAERAKKGDIRSAYFELLWITTLEKNFSQAELVVPSGKKGRDFDIILLDGWGLSELNVEVKSRPTPFHNTNRLINFLQKSEDQLPRNSFGAIVFSVNPTTESLTQLSIDSSLSIFLNKSSRIRYVGYCWESVSTPTELAFSYNWLSAAGECTSMLELNSNIISEEAFLQEVCGEQIKD